MDLIDKIRARQILLLRAGLSVVVLTIVVFLVRQCSVPVSHISDERAGGDTLNVAVELSPMTLSTASDTICGFGYDILMKIARDNGIPVKINAFSSLPEALARLNSRRYDLVISDMPVTASLRQKYGFTVPVYRDRQVLVQLADSLGGVPVKSQQELGGKEVWAAVGTPVVARLHTLASEIGDTICVYESDSYTEEQLLMAVAIGEIPRAASGQFVARRMAADYPQLDTSVDLSFSQLKCWTTHKEDTLLLDSLNSWINACVKSRDFSILLKKYDLE